MTTIQPFGGAKIALIRDGDVLTYLRDDKPTIPYPARWDFPGGGREGDETPEACALRELQEEFGLTLAPDRIHWGRLYEGPRPQQRTYFFVATLAAEEAGAIVFGDEGQHWRFMTIAEFLAHSDAIAHLRARLADYLSETAP
ncbi:MAG: NUDIX hydrolase [Hyphomonadaceae bacterium]|nr:NUDIX hydrolase [Hyphomonadaceae bacterium]